MTVAAGVWASPLVQIELAVQDRAKTLALDMTSTEAPAVLAGLVDEEIARWRGEYQRGRRDRDIAEPSIAAERALRNLAGYGPLQPLLDDPDVWEIMVNGPDGVFLQVAYVGMTTECAVGVYCRISRDSEGRAEGVTVQERKARKLADQEWPGRPVRVFVDNDLTAADPTVSRPAYGQLVDAIRRGEIGEVVCAEQSRLTRQPAEWEDLVVTLTRAGIKAVHCYRTGTVDVGGSRLIGRILAAVDAEEVEKLKLRIRDRQDALAAEGRPGGGTSYGYANTVDAAGRKTRTVIPEQAAVLRETADRVLAGWSLISIARDLTERGAPTRRGGAWSSTTVKTMVTAPTAAGFRVHRGEIVGKGSWEPILDEATWAAVRARLTGARTVTRSDGGTYTVSGRQQPGRRYLLTGGLAVCGRCGAPLMAQQRISRAGGRQPSYLCHPLRGGCGGLGISAWPLEEHVAGELFGYLASPEFVASMASDTAGEARARLLERAGLVDERRADLARRWAAGSLSGGEWDAARQVLDVEAADLARQIDELPGPTLQLDAGTVQADWQAMTLDERRHVLRSTITSVSVAKAKPGTRRFDPGRVTITWR